MHSCDVIMSTVIFLSLFLWLFCFIFSFGDRVSLHTPGWSGTHRLLLCFCLCLQEFWDLRPTWPFSLLLLITGLWEPRDKCHMVTGLAAGQIFC